MSDSPIALLHRWGERGVSWRADEVSDAGAVVELFRPSGDRLGELRSSDAELIGFLRARRVGPAACSSGEPTT